jgi:hypothetical protein
MPGNRLLRIATLVLPLFSPVVAKADVILDFVQTNLTFTDTRFGVPTSRITAQIVLTDEAYANGFSASIVNSSGPPFSASIDGLRGFTAAVFNGGSQPVVTTSLDRFLTPLNPFSSGFTNALSVSGPAGGPVSGSIQFNNTEDQFGLTFNSASGFTGFFNTDRPGGCNITGNCRISGEIIIVSVPEPSGLAVLLLGGLALGWAARRPSETAQP